MNSPRVLPVVIALSLVATAAASAQSLGDIAKQEEARRKTVKAPGKVYTNDSLHAEPAPSSPPPSAATPAQPEAAAPAAESPAATQEPRNEAYWKKRVADAREALARSQTFAEALQTRINALTTDFTNQADPVRRSQIGNDRQKALDELDRVKKEIEASTKAITSIQEEARRAGVPAGWAR